MPSSHLKHNVQVIRTANSIEVVQLAKRLSCPEKPNLHVKPTEMGSFFERNRNLIRCRCVLGDNTSLVEA